jgi:hypothetical protein
VFECVRVRVCVCVCVGGVWAAGGSAYEIDGKAVTVVVAVEVVMVVVVVTTSGPNSHDGANHARGHTTAPPLTVTDTHLHSHHTPPHHP